MDRPRAPISTHPERQRQPEELFVVEYLKTGAPHVRPVDDDITRAVRGYLADISARGEVAIREMSHTFDNWTPSSFRLSEDQIALYSEQVDPQLVAHIESAADRVRRFAAAQLETVSDLRIELSPGYVAGHRHVPVSSVGAYVAGGRYQLISSALMSVVPAKIAGVPRIVAVLGPRRAQGPSAATVVAARMAGADEIWSIGGVQALAALAFGCLPGMGPVDMIVGAGNDYVAEAKRQLFGRVGVDLLAGPSEVAIIADESADPELVAADLLAQAEHGPTSPVLLITTSAQLGRAVLRHIDELLARWATAEVAGTAWRDFGAVAVVADHVEAAKVSNEFAGEHVQLMVDDPDAYGVHLTEYGSLFIGAHTPVVFGDKASGPNHTLPTQRAARYTGGLSALKYLKTVTFQEATESGADVIARDAEAIANAEGMFGHAESAALRRVATPAQA
jgi:sulfopropanediol 3-dehydrogenase